MTVVAQKKRKTSPASDPPKAGDITPEDALRTLKRVERSLLRQIAATAKKPKPKSVHRPKNPRRLTPLGILRLHNPAAWEQQVRAAMKKAGGSPPDAAAELGISTRQLFRILGLPVFADIERAPPGRPT